MEKMKQCPSCGKYVAADKTYCMNCGTTLGIRCPDCRKVVPVGSKACTECGHSFVVKKKRRLPTVWPKITKHARPILGVLLILLMLTALIMAAVPSFSFSLTETVKREEILTLYKASGWTLIGYFLGAHPAGVTALLARSEFADAATGLRFSLYGLGLGWLILLVGLALSLILLIPNYKRMTSVTAKRLLPLYGVTGFGGLLAGGMAILVNALLRSASAAAWPAPAAEEGAKAAADAAAFVPPYRIAAAVPVVMGVMLLVSLGFLLALHISAFRKLTVEVDGEGKPLTDEMSLGFLLLVPFRAIRRLVRRLAAKGKSRKHNPEEKTVECTKRFTYYLILFGAALIFTQALLSKVSNIFFWFVLILPVILLVYTLVARAALQVSMLSDSATTEKNTPYTYEFRIENRSILAFPFIEAEVSIPQSNSVRTSERTIRIAMAPMSSYHMKNTVRFRFRGTYDIGVRCFYVYDFFRLFRVTVPVQNMTTVYVLPRRLSPDQSPAQSISDSTARTVRSPLVVDKLEVSDIREYRAGDSLKSIHWKLSSKSETFVVKDYNTGTSNQTVIFCDLAAHFPDEPPKKQPAAASENAEAETPDGKSKKKKKTRKERRAEKKALQDKQAKARRRRSGETDDTHAISDEALDQRLSDRAAAARSMTGSDGTILPEEAAAPAPAPEVCDVHELGSPVYYEDMNEYLADGVVELTIANVLAELNQGHETLLIWFDRRSDAGVFAFPLRGADEFERIFTLFGTAPLCDKSKSVASLTAMVGDTESAKQLFVVSTMDQDMLTSLSDLPGVSDAANFGSAEVLLYNPEERFRHLRERTLYLDGCREQLASSGLDLLISHTPAPAAAPEGGESA